MFLSHYFIEGSGIHDVSLKSTSRDHTSCVPEPSTRAGCVIASILSLSLSLSLSHFVSFYLTENVAKYIIYGP